MPKLIVFDWNGTLLADTIPSWKAGNMCLEFFDHRAISLQQYRDTFTFPILHFYKRNGIGVDKVLAHEKESNAIFQSHYERLAARARLRKGARDLLAFCYDRNYSCIILSNFLTDRINAHLKRLKIDHYFHHVSAHNCDGTTILHATTKTERLSSYMVKRGYKPDDTIIIGDSMEEPDIARHLGLHSIGITDGYISRKRLKKANPDVIVNHLGEIKNLL